MAAEKNLVYACVFFILFSGVSASDFSGFFDQIKEVSRGFNLSNVGDLINEAVVPGSLLEKGQDFFKKSQDLLKQARQGNVSLDTIVGMLPKDANGKATAASSLNKLGLSVREVVSLAGLGKNEHVARVAEQFISDPQNLDENGKVVLSLLPSKMISIFSIGFLCSISRYQRRHTQERERKFRNFLM